MVRKRWVVEALLAIGVAGLLLIVGLNAERSFYFVASDDAHVAQTLVPAEAPRAGYLERLGVHIGQRVRRGEVLARLAAIGGGTVPLTSPVNGRVAAIFRRDGSGLFAGEPWAELWRSTPPRVVADIAETDLGGVRRGDPVDIVFPADPGRTYHGRVEAVQRATAGGQSAPSAVTQLVSGTSGPVRVPVWIRVLGPPRGAGFLPGLSAHVLIHVHTRGVKS